MLNDSVLKIFPHGSFKVTQLSKKVYQYSLKVIDSEQDVQNLTAAFTSIPSQQDWSDWLSGWSSIGYSLFGSPRLIRVL